MIPPRLAGAPGELRPPPSPGGGALVRLLVAVWAAAAVTSSCAYYTVSGGMPGGIRSVAVPVAANATAESRVAEKLTERLVAAYTRDGQLRVVDADRAEAVLQLRLEAVDDAPFTYTAAEVTQQYRLHLVVAADLVRTADDEVLTHLERLEGSATYDASLPDDQGRDPALLEALDMVVEEVVDRTTAGW